jgi:hypothetical protein
MRFIIIGICSLFFHVSSNECLAVVIQNASFEDPFVPTAQLFPNGQTIGTGWTVVSGTTTYVISNSAGQGSTPFGRQFLEIHGDGVSQTVSGLAPGSTYELSYYATASSNEIYSGTAQIIASIAGVNDIFSFTLLGTNPYGSSAFPWQERKFRFTAIAPTAELTINATGATGIPISVIDNISINEIPEPSSWLVLVGLTLVGKLSNRTRDSHPTRRSK